MSRDIGEVGFGQVLDHMERTIPEEVVAAGRRAVSRFVLGVEVERSTSVRVDDTSWPATWRAGWFVTADLVAGGGREDVR